MDLFDIVISGKIRKEGGGGDVEVDALSVTENGTYSASSGHAYSPVTVSVPTGIIPSGTLSITSNGVYDVGSFASADVNVSGGGGGDTAVIERSYGSIYENSEASIIASYVFYSNSTITSVNFPNVKGINNQAFQNCIKLATANFSNVLQIGYGAFQSCSMLKEANFPELTTITGSMAFVHCWNLSTVRMPKLIATSAQTFSNCSALSVTQFDALQSISGSTFGYCGALSVISLPNVSYIGPSAFAQCKNLMSIYLLSDSAATLSNVNAFSGTPMRDSSYTGAFGSIYVPASLVNTYKSKTGWSTISDRITSYVEG